MNSPPTWPTSLNPNSCIPRGRGAAVSLERYHPVPFGGIVVEFRLVAKQRLQRPRRTVHLVADAANVEDDKILAVGIDQALQFADHAPATLSLSSTLER